VRKPDPEFFSKLVRKSGQPAESLLFFDDLVENVAAARQAGLEAVVFDGDVERVIAELRARGIDSAR
jgi:FMN phosphatase YigB (HAD superfamily)